MSSRKDYICPPAFMGKNALSAPSLFWKDPQGSRLTTDFRPMFVHSALSSLSSFRPAVLLSNAPDTLAYATFSLRQPSVLEKVGKEMCQHGRMFSLLFRFNPMAVPQPWTSNIMMYMKLWGPSLSL